jgi:hypothetical protein
MSIESWLIASQKLIQFGIHNMKKMHEKKKKTFQKT